MNTVIKVSHLQEKEVTEILNLKIFFMLFITCINKFYFFYCLIFNPQQTVKNVFVTLCVKIESIILMPLKSVMIFKILT